MTQLATNNNIVLKDVDFNVRISASSVNTGSDFYTFDAPSVSNLLNVNVPSSGYSMTTMIGVNFGAADFSATTYIQTAYGSTSCVSTDWVSDTMVKCLNKEADYGGGVTKVSLGSMVRVKALVGTRTTGLTSDAPIISNLRAPNFPQSQGNTITLDGINFGNGIVTPTASFEDQTDGGCGECSICVPIVLDLVSCHVRLVLSCERCMFITEDCSDEGLFAGPVLKHLDHLDHELICGMHRARPSRQV